MEEREERGGRKEEWLREEPRIIEPSDLRPIYNPVYK